LARIATDFTPAVFASSLAAEDMVLTDMILRTKLPIGIFTLETGRLHKETLGIIERIKDKYQYDVALFRPEPAVVETYVKEHGLNAFYDSVELRKECCRIRKVEPLHRALIGKKAWITGQRRAQSTTRSELEVQEQDDAHGIGRKVMFGSIYARTRFRIIHCMIKVTHPSAASHAPVRFSQAKMCVPVAGGGKIQNRRNVACILWMASWFG
jgi:3'-phosphoadenosine 5'-phosphosulfate sulfotransferase (PAPS reductase)/FAD synthetase